MNNATEFLDYISKNGPRLKKNLKKNITYNDDIFDDVFQTVILKIYDSIVKNDKWVDDFEQYFFIASKFEYILHDNRAKKAKSIHSGVESAKEIIDDEYDYERETEIQDVLSELTEYLITTYGERDADIFLAYFRRKSEKKCSYREIAEMYSISVKEASEIIRRIKSDNYMQKTFYGKYKNLN